MPFTTTAQSLRRLPLFFAYCPDKPGVLSKRLEVRPAHWARWAKDREEGYGEFGMGYLPQPHNTSSSTSTSTPDPNASVTLPEGVQPMAGSVLLFRADNLHKAWERIRADVYWTEGVWDQGNCKVEQFIQHELYNDLPTSTA